VALDLNQVWEGDDGIPVLGPAGPPTTVLTAGHDCSPRCLIRVIIIIKSSNKRVILFIYISSRRFLYAIYIIIYTQQCVLPPIRSSGFGSPQ
jgi:hypothetical protein